MPTYVSPFTGTVVTPTDVSYYPLSFSTAQTLAWPAAVNPPEVPAARIIDCVASAAGLTITLPPADEGTLGADILFRNLGAFSFNVVDADGGQSLTITAGLAKYVYLTDNTTAAGTWENVTFGAGTSYADATTLASYGLTTVNGKLATTQNISTITATPTLNNTSRATTYVWEGGAGTINLPIPANLSTGWFIAFRNQGTGTLTITPPSPALINGIAQIEANPGDSGFIMYDVSSAGYYTVGWQPAANVSFTAATYDVDAIPGDTLNLTAFAPIIQTYVAQSKTRTTTLEVTLPAITQVYMIVNNTDETGYDITFQNSGSTQPPFSLSAGGVAILLSDGQSLYSLNQGAAGLIYAVDGSAAVPSISFSNSSSTGLYLVGANIMGITAQGVQIAEFDGSNLLAPLINFIASLSITGDLTVGGTINLTTADISGNATVGGTLTADVLNVTTDADVTGTLTAGLITGGSF